MSRIRDLRLALALCLVSLGTLAAEVLMIRTFEVILMPHIGYAVITCAMFAFGAAGAVATLWPVPAGGDVRRRLAVLAVLFAASLVLLRPALNAEPTLYRSLGDHKLLGLLAAGSSTYLLVLLPFFFSGLLLAHLFSARPSEIRRLYFFDLVGAAIGCVIYLPFERAIGPGGLFICIAAAGLVAAGLLGRSPAWKVASYAAAVALVAIPFLRDGGIYEFRQIQEKRGVMAARAAGRIEFTAWDPAAKIDVVNELPTARRVQYDDGSQTSDLFPFDGDLPRLRRQILNGTRPIHGNFWHASIMAADYLKRDSGARVLIIGSAAGQGTKAALMFNPRHVDGIELVGTVVDLVTGPYADFIGGVFLDPRVQDRVAEGRGWLRWTSERYDIIQIYSNYNPSVALTGVGAFKADYLQTAQAYEEYFSHLTPNGILQVNHQYFPRSVTTAALAWKRMGWHDFQGHIAVYEDTTRVDYLPTVLIKRSPWTAGDLQQIDDLFGSVDEATHQVLVVDPLHPSRSFLPAGFFSGSLSDSLQATVPYTVYPITDDRPFFDNIQKGLLAHDASSDPGPFTTKLIASVLSDPFKVLASAEDVHYPLGTNTIPVAIGALGILFAILLIGVPLKFSSAGRVSWPAKYWSLSYFALLGAGFIVIELVMIQLFTVLIGYPLYAYTAVIFGILLSAGVGSLAAHRLDVAPDRRWILPFAGVILSGLLLLLLREPLFQVFLAEPTLARIGASVAMIFPMGFFMGMPFPLGILWLEGHPRGAVAWAWGVNGVFTVLGGVTSGVLALHLGFQATVLIALGVYAAAGLVFALLRRRAAGTGAESARLASSPPARQQEAVA